MGDNRKSMSKGLRFDVFRRDGFTCQYCGRTPPDTVLHVDHIRPVSDGGDNDISNLVTSCELCNLGKSAKKLDVGPRPDTDLAWLSTQQEIAELRRYQIAKAERDALNDRIVVQLQDTWVSSSGLDWRPAHHIVIGMLSKYSPDAIEYAFSIVGPKVADGYVDRRNGAWLKYVYGVLKQESAAQESQAPGAKGARLGTGRALAQSPVAASLQAVDDVFAMLERAGGMD
ncbi:MAG: HNH endonuclease [Caldilineaceae bacterium]|nr:HNH endonuclease [Caldilineaceae bacterium]